MEDKVLIRNVSKNKVQNTVNMDIINIHHKIESFYEKEKLVILEYKQKIKDLQEIIDKADTNIQKIQLMSRQIKRYEKCIKKNSQYSYEYYIHKVSLLLDRLNKILKTPVQIDFMTNKVKENPLKKQLCDQYLNILHEFPNLKKFLPNDTVIENNNMDHSDDDDKTICHVCKNDKNFEIVENYYICVECGMQQMSHKTMTSYNDGDRINIYTKYTYDRKNHFKDCINQYQGTQHTKIEDFVYKDLEKEFEKHHLLVGDSSTPKKVRFQNITKKHVLMFLKELKYHKHYENFVLIHYKMTGVPPDDIRHLFDKLLDDFEVITELYDKLNKENKLPMSDSYDNPRKNFINTQYVLYALLCRHKHRIDRTSINMLKTKDRIFWHDKVIRILFEHLGWNFTENF